MNLSKNNIVWSVLSLFFISFSFYQYYDKNKLIFKLNNLNSKLGHLTQYYEARKNIEGKNIWEITNIAKDLLFELENKHKISSDFLMVIIDTVNCYACLEYHIKRLSMIKKYTTPIMVFTNNYDVLFHDVSKIIITDNHSNNYIVNSFPKKFIIAMVNIDGKIIYGDFPSPYNIEESSSFYEVLSRYLKK